MASRNHHTQVTELGAALYFTKRVLAEMEIDKLELVTDTFVSILILGVAVAESADLSWAFAVIAFIQGVKLPRLMRAYYKIKAEKAKQARFDT